MERGNVICFVFRLLVGHLRNTNQIQNDVVICTCLRTLRLSYDCTFNSGKRYFPRQPSV